MDYKDLEKALTEYRIAVNEAREKRNQAVERAWQEFYASRDKAEDAYLEAKDRVKASLL